jgi:hypothetical protein
MVLPLQDQSIKLKEEYHHFRNRSGWLQPHCVAILWLGA